MKNLKLIVVLPRLATHWLRMFTGRSYWHLPQGLGKHFNPNDLAGYFNDMTAKTVWKGPTNRNGFPLVEINGKFILFPTTLLQKALGHWDLTFEDSNQANYHRSEFLKLAFWALEAQLPDGGWSLWPLLMMSFPSHYSAMTQGEGISVLARAYTLTGDELFLQAAERAINPMLLDITQGGVGRKTSEGVVLEEYPRHELDGVLNGWVFAIFGLRDLLTVSENLRARALMDSSVYALTQFLHGYRMTYWSHYDLKGTIASPFYHQLHIAQLKALELAFPEYEHDFKSTRLLFERQARSRFKKTRAMASKLIQKLSKLPTVVAR
jgi:heparosan-N-sulfate-glucuronate 5-epimerase